MFIEFKCTAFCYLVLLRRRAALKPPFGQPCRPLSEVETESREGLLVPKDQLVSVLVG
jgi:hypothetical protein